MRTYMHGYMANVFLTRGLSVQVPTHPQILLCVGIPPPPAVLFKCRFWLYLGSLSGNPWGSGNRVCHFKSLPEWFSDSLENISPSRTRIDKTCYLQSRQKRRKYKWPDNEPTAWTCKPALPEERKSLFSAEEGPLGWINFHQSHLAAVNWFAPKQARFISHPKFKY